MEYNTLWHGKYRNYTFLQVETSDKRYCAWVLRSESLPLSLRLFQHYLKQRHGGIFTIGKHAYNWYDAVVSSDPGYTAWAASLSDASGDLSKFQSYLVKLAGRRPPPARRRISRSPRRGSHTPMASSTGFASTCKICYTDPISTIFVKCRHMVCCRNCVTQVVKKHRACPICRAPLTMRDVVDGILS